MPSSFVSHLSPLCDIVRWSQTMCTHSDEPRCNSCKFCMVSQVPTSMANSPKQSNIYCRATFSVTSTCVSFCKPSVIVSVAHKGTSCARNLALHMSLSRKLQWRGKRLAFYITYMYIRHFRGQGICDIYEIALCSRDKVSTTTARIVDCYNWTESEPSQWYFLLRKERTETQDRYLKHSP